MGKEFSWYKELPTFIIFMILCIPFLLSPLIIFGRSISFLVLACWLFLVVFSLKKGISYGYEARYSVFYWCTIFAIVYIMFCDIIFLNQTLPKLIIPFHIIAVLCLIYSFYFVSKLLVTAEEKKPIKLNRCIGTFLLFWFFPLGVWFIHRRLRKVLDGNKD